MALLSNQYFNIAQDFWDLGHSFSWFQMDKTYHIYSSCSDLTQNSSEAAQRLVTESITQPAVPQPSGAALKIHC